jgi:hypothetical protein
LAASFFPLGDDLDKRRKDLHATLPIGRGAGPGSAQACSMSAKTIQTPPVTSWKTVGKKAPGLLGGHRPGGGVVIGEVHVLRQ